MTERAIVGDPAVVAPVLIDLQNGIVGMPLEPMSGKQVIASVRAAADPFRASGAPIVLPTMRRLETDCGAPLAHEPMPAITPGRWDEIADDLDAAPREIRVAKTGWSGFASTDLDPCLRARGGIKAIVLAGVATNFGVEETAREAVRLGSSVVLGGEAMVSVTEEHHAFAW